MKNRHFWSEFAVATIALSASAAFAGAPTPLEKQLQAFRAKPREFMNGPVLKRARDGRPVDGRTVFSPEDVQTHDFVLHRAYLRKKLFPESPSGGRAAFASDDLARDLVDQPESLIDRIEDMEKLKSAQLAESPWSDDYWGIYRGVLACRYDDYDFPTDWKSAFDYAVAHPASKLFNPRNASSVDSLSPAEKYDLLIGDQAGTFTQANWREGQQYFDQDGEVATWMGICHGWSAASFMVPRPKAAVTVKAADGVTPITFYPSEIKALASLLWAKNDAPNRFVGGRCDVKEPKQDENGRILDRDCFDNNPGTFHTVLVNQIGVSGRSLVMDATYDQEVWNQPIYGYSYTYFNPQTGREAKKLSTATVEMAKYTKDKFKKYRSKKAASVVGVAMTVTYMVETRPTRLKYDSPANDGAHSVTYLYDLELDSSGKIVGGEWYQNKHPDFLWTVVPGIPMRTPFDSYARGRWNPDAAMPLSWRNAAQRAAYEQTPLAAIVDSLVEWSNR